MGIVRGVTRVVCGTRRLQPAFLLHAGNWYHHVMSTINIPTRLTLAGLLVIAAPFAFLEARADDGARSGKEVVESVCVACHGSGAKGAPRIGDRTAWSKRAEQGLTSLTEHALTGIREMPSHGGNVKLSDLEIQRAIAYMVNQSGGHWVEPSSAKTMSVQLTGEQVVEAQCSKCHKEGVGGAPRIGDREAWTPRLGQGLDHLVSSAIRGHGGMPPRGDRADLSDAEIRNAIVYMFNPVAAPKPNASSTSASPAKSAGNFKAVGGMEIYLGFVPAEVLRAYPQESAERSLHGGVPSGAGYFHVNVSLFDRTSKTPVAGAEVRLRIALLNGTGVSRTLEPVTLNSVPGYGNYVRLRRNTQYVMTVRVQKSDAPRAVEARFYHKVY